MRRLKSIRLRVRERRLATKKKRFLTEDEKRTIRERFPNEFTYVIARQMGRSYSSVANYAYQAGVHKSEEFRAREYERQAQRLKECGNPHRFEKGHTPHNKGSKMSPEVYAKAKATMFKKGQTPHNTKPDGYERVDADGYTQVRVNGKFFQKHHLVWEQANGPVPKGMSVVFKDGNKQNFALDNLELLNRKELMLRNTIQRYPEEIISTIKVLSKLKKHLYAKEQN